MSRAWWTTVSHGGAMVTHYRTDWPRGPWKSREAAEEAVERWRKCVRDMAGTIEAAHSVRIAGPFPSRAVARKVDVSDWPEHVDPDAGTYWTTWGSVRGTCDHRHREERTARECLERDRRACGALPGRAGDRPFSDRAVYRMPPGSEPRNTDTVGERAPDPF